MYKFVFTMNQILWYLCRVNYLSVFVILTTSVLYEKIKFHRKNILFSYLRTCVNTFTIRMYVYT